MLTDPKLAFTESPSASAVIELTCNTEGLGAAMGQDQDQHHLIFLPGQADYHYQHLNRVTGNVDVGEERFEVDGRGGKDHSWGPRNWHAKIYLRWLICGIDDDNGFMLTRAVGPTKQTRSGFMWIDRRFHVVDGYELTNRYAGAPHYQLLRTDVTMRAAGVEWTAVGLPLRHLPLRHRQPDEHGAEATLRIVKQPAEWTFADGRSGAGHLEYHDLLRDGVPVGLHD
jgi:predicted secreted hydrolase